MEGETIQVKGRESFDDWGNLVENHGGRDIPGCVIQPASATDINNVDVVDGARELLKVMAAGSVAVQEGELVEVRNQLYRVAYVPFDWTVGRRPWNTRHVPRTEFYLERSEG